MRRASHGEGLQAFGFRRTARRGAVTPFDQLGSQEAAAAAWVSPGRLPLAAAPPTGREPRNTSRNTQLRLVLTALPWTYPSALSPALAGSLETIHNSAGRARRRRIRSVRRRAAPIEARFAGARAGHRGDCLRAARDNIDKEDSPSRQGRRVAGSRPASGVCLAVQVDIISAVVGAVAQQRLLIGQIRTASVSNGRGPRDAQRRWSR